MLFARPPAVLLATSNVLSFTNFFRRPHIADDANARRSQPLNFVHSAVLVPL